MNWLDLVILLIVGLSAALGLKIGLIRAGSIALGIFLGGVLGGQLSDDISGRFGIDSDGAVATVISYSVIIAMCIIAAAVASVMLRKFVDVLLLNWADQVAGVALGIVAGAIISTAAIIGIANLAYSSNVEDKFASRVLNSMFNIEKAKQRLEDGLTQSALVDVVINVVDVVPASTIWFVPSSIKSALDVLELRQASSGG
jgi:membrane protein required for colicin V production